MRAGGGAGHFEADVEAFPHAEVFHEVVEIGLARVDGGGCAHLAGDVEAVGIEVGDDDVAGAGVLGDADGHAADGTGAGDDNVLAVKVEGEGGVGGVAEGVEAGEDVEGDVGIAAPDVGSGDDEVVGERAVAVDADAEGVRAEVAGAGEAVAAVSADDVAFAGDEGFEFPAADVFADGFDVADVFVADDHGGFDGGGGPVVPLVDVDVRPADGGLEDFDPYVVGAGFRDGKVVPEFESGAGGGFDEGAHGGGG